MVFSLRNLCNLCVFALLFSAASDWALSQELDSNGPPSDRQSQGGGGRNRRGFGGFGGRGGFGITGELRNDATLQELGVTDEQKQQLDELNQGLRAMRDNNPKLQEIFSKMRDASDEERQLLRAEMQIEMTKAQAEAETKIKEIIGDEKTQRLRQISYHHQGVSAVTQDSVSRELGLSAAQLEQLNRLQDDQRSAFRELGFDPSPEDRQKVVDEFRTKITAVLTPEQQTKWQGMIGPPPADTAAAGGNGAAAPTGATPPRPRRPPVIVEAPPGVTPEVSFGTEASKTQKLKFGFRYAPWMDVLKLFAESASLSLDLNAVPPGTFSYYDTREYTPTEALDILNGYLLPKGFILVRRDDFLVCISIDEEIAPNLVPVIGTDELARRGKNELLTVMFPLQGVDVEQIAKEIDQVKGPQGKVVGMKTTNSLLVTDIGSNLLRIQSLLSGATRGGPNDMVFKPYSMKFLPATEAEQVLRGLLGLQVSATNVSGDGRSSGGGRGFGFGTPPQSTTTARTTTSKAQITADTRTNALLVSATAAEHQLIEEALKAIDVEAEESDGAAGSGKPFLRVYKIKSADTREVTKTIDALMPGVVVNEDTSIRAISIFASDKQHSEVDTLIRQLDGGGGAEQVAVIPLSKMDVSVAVSTLQSMFVRDGGTAPTIQADQLGRQVMVRGSADQLAQVKTLLAELGEDGTGRKKGSEAGSIRRYPISGRDPEELLPLIERMWGTASPHPIRIVTPGQRDGGENSSGAIKGIQRPARESRKAPKADTADQPATSLNRPGNTVASRRLSRALRVQTTGLAADEQDQEDEDEAAEPSNVGPSESTPDSELDEDAQLERLLRDSGAVGPTVPAAEPDGAENADQEMDAPTADGQKPATGEASPVVITVLGDELLLTSEDPASLDQLEELLAKTMEILPPRLQWTVFTLQSADATEVATMLQQLIPESSVSSSSSTSGGFGALTGGVSSFGSSLMGMTGLGNMAASPQTLQIIPELRLNALFVAGPSSKVREVEEMLKVLDSSELPDNLRNKSSHVVQLEYADAQEVYDVLKDVYKGYLEDGSNNPQANALAMLMGGGRGRNEANQKPKAQLALGIDKRTNQIIVWGDETLSQEIEALALNLDESAQAAKRTVRVLSLQNTNSSVVTSALGQLMPKVKVSSSGPRTSSSSNSGNGTSPGTTSSGGTSSSGNQPSNQDQQMRELFRQRMMQGGMGGGPFGGGGGDGGDNGGSRNPFGGGNRGRNRRGN